MGVKCGLSLTRDDRLKMIQNEMWRKIFIPMKVEVKRSTLTSTLNISRIIQLWRMRHKENILNLGEMLSAYRILTRRIKRRVILEIGGIAMLKLNLDIGTNEWT
jgi:hypothetical protein